MASSTASPPDEGGVPIVSSENGNATASENRASSADGSVPIDISKRTVAILNIPESNESAPSASEANDLHPQTANRHSSDYSATSQHIQPSPQSCENMDRDNSSAHYSGYSSSHINHNEHEDIDPAALLESLASYEPSQGHSSNTSYPEPNLNGCQNSHHHQQTNQFENDHFASLLQAAATAGQNQENDHHRHYETHSRDSQPLQEWTAHSLKDQQQQQKSKPQRRKHSEISRDATSTPNTEPSSLWNRSISRKLTDADDAALARERAIWGPESDHNENEESSQSYAPLSPSSARAAGVHSAAALFRKPTLASKKYTRPPMSKLFTSLELTPEQFLHLQAAAKSYMLDPAHPDRYNCVGNKAKVDTDMVKLKLFNCVETFLEDEGWGERCWGTASERDPSKTWWLRWPESRNKIITRVTPLLRRMVTNERQRRYAVETRSKDKGVKSVTTSSPNRPNGQPPLQENQLSLEIDPKLGDYHYSLAVSTTHSTPLETHSVRDDSPDISQLIMSFSVVLLHPQNANLVIKTDDVSSTPNNSQQQVRRYIQSCFTDPGITRQFRGTLVTERVRAHLPEGLRDVGSVEEWESVVKTVQQTAWMNGELKIVVNIGIVEEVPENGDSREPRREQPVSPQ